MPELQESVPEKVPELRRNPGKCLFKNTGFVIIEFKYIQTERGYSGSGNTIERGRAQFGGFLVCGASWCVSFWRFFYFIKTGRKIFPCSGRIGKV